MLGKKSASGIHEVKQWLNLHSRVNVKIVHISNSTSTIFLRIRVGYTSSGVYMTRYVRRRRMNKPLKPCPFCGSEELDITMSDIDTFYVVCLGCGSCGRDEKRVEKAIASWNRRDVGEKVTRCGSCRWRDIDICRLHKHSVSLSDYCSSGWDVFDDA